ncbi:MAG TPA: hypothetical protein VIK22_06775 [Candidatus Anoxymicrobiaceae bacterium]
MEEKGAGWLTFASIMLVIAGVGNFIWGITAIARKELLVHKFLFANLTFWGIVFIVVGAFLVVAGIALLNEAQWARWFGITFCSLSIIFYLLVIWAYPVWSVMVIAIDVLIIFGLAEHGARQSA